LDTEEIASILVNGTFRLGKKNPSRFSLTGRFGKRIMGQADLLLYPGAMSNFNFTYIFKHDDINVNYRGRRHHNMAYNYHAVDVGYNDMNFWKQNLKLSAGLRYERYYSRTNLASTLVGDFRLPEPRTEGYVSYYANLQYESFDNHYFPHSGTRVTGSLNLYTDNFIQYRGGNPFGSISLSWTTAIPISNRFTLTPSIYGRMLAGNDIPLWYINVVGGNGYGLYLPHQLQFDGIGFIEAAPNTFIATKLTAQQRLWRKHYISATFNYGMGENRFLNLFAGQQYFGASLNYGYDSPIGPLKATINWSNMTRRPGFFLQLGYSF
jgi:NTE family protein